jgi:predicted kinase
LSFVPGEHDRDACPLRWIDGRGLGDGAVRVSPDREGCSRLEQSRQQRCGIARLILVNGPPGSGKSTVAHRYVRDHDRVALVEVDELRMTLPDWEEDEATRLGARELAAVAIESHLAAGRDVVMAQYFGRLGYIVLLEDLARKHSATFVEVILAPGAALSIDRFRSRRRTMTERGERHPERDIADADIEQFVLDAVDRLARLPTARPQSRVVPVALDASEDEIYDRLLSALDEEDRP